MCGSNQTSKYREFQVEGGAPVKAWVDGVPFNDNAKDQLINTSKLPIIHKWVAAMPDVHFGMGATIGSVIPTLNAIIPAAVGVDIGCGMMAVKTSLSASQLPDNLSEIRSNIERAVPHGRTGGGKRRADKGSWQDLPDSVAEVWKDLEPEFRMMKDKYRPLREANTYNHLGTLGTGNHFIELCLDESDGVWVMLHSGSRGVGNKIGMSFIEKAKEDMRIHMKNLPDENLAYFKEGTEYFDDYVQAVGWAQNFARENRKLMMKHVLEALGHSKLPEFTTHLEAVNCHHNYVQKERHFGEEVFITRKGAVRAGKDELGIIPGSMGAKSFIVRGKGNKDSFESCSHGAGRTMSRNQAKKQFTIEDHKKATEGVECRKDAAVIDETPAAYKSIDAVMEAQSDLVEIVHTLKQVVCVKG